MTLALCLGGRCDGRVMDMHSPCRIVIPAPTYRFRASYWAEDYDVPFTEEVYDCIGQVHTDVQYECIRAMLRLRRHRALDDVLDQALVAANAGEDKPIGPVLFIYAPVGYFNIGRIYAGFSQACLDAGNGAWPGDGYFLSTPESNVPFYLIMTMCPVRDRIAWLEKEAKTRPHEFVSHGTGPEARPAYASPYAGEHVAVGALRTSSFDSMRVAYDKREWTFMDGPDVQWFVVPKKWALDNSQLFKRWYEGRGVKEPEREIPGEEKAHD